MGAFNYFKPLGKSWWIPRIFLDRIGIKVSHKLIDFHFSRIFLFVALASNYFSNVALLEFLHSFLVFFFSVTFKGNIALLRLNESCG